MEDGLNYLFWAYTILWVVTFGYVFSLGKRYNGIKKELEQLEKMIKEG